MDQWEMINPPSALLILILIEKNVNPKTSNLKTIIFL